RSPSYADVPARGGWTFSALPSGPISIRRPAISISWSSSTTFPRRSTPTPTFRSRKTSRRSSAGRWISLPRPAWKTRTSAIAFKLSVSRSMHADARKLLWDARRAAERVAHFTQGKTFAELPGGRSAALGRGAPARDRWRGACPAPPDRSGDPRRDSRAAPRGWFAQRPDSRICQRGQPDRLGIIEVNLGPLRTSL